jgi:hypothetical protein
VEEGEEAEGGRRGGGGGGDGPYVCMDGGAVPRYVTSQCEHKDTNEADEEKRGDSPCTVRSVGVVVSPVSSPNHVMYFFFLFFLSPLPGGDEK